MARQKGSTSLGNNLELKVAAPLDAREVVETKSDLTDASTWDYPFAGMKVIVRDEAKMYILKQKPHTVAENWVQSGADIDISVLEEEVAKKAEGYITTVTEEVNIGDDYVLTEGQIVKIKSSDGTQEYQGVTDATGKAVIEVENKNVTVVHDGTALTLSNPDGADIDETKVEVITETIHKIDSRLLPKGDKSETADYLGESLTVKEAQGKYKVGDVILKDTSLEDIIRNMLLKKNVPTLTEPSVTITGTGNKLLETGATQNVTLTINFNRGSISPAYGTDGYRAGEATAYSINGGSEQIENTFTEIVAESNNSFIGKVNYAAGQQPKDDEGENYDEPKAAGSMNTSALVYEFVDPIYSNVANINTMAKETLVKRSVGEKVFTFPPAPAETPEKFDIPAAWNVIAVEVLNDMSGKYESCDEFATSTTTHPNAGGVEVEYVRYTDTRGYDAGSRTIKVRWS